MNKEKYPNLYRCAEFLAQEWGKRLRDVEWSEELYCADEKYNLKQLEEQAGRLSDEVKKEFSVVGSYTMLKRYNLKELDSFLDEIVNEPLNAEFFE